MKDIKRKNWKKEPNITQSYDKSINKAFCKNDTTVATKTKDWPINLLGNQDNCILCQKSISVKKMPDLIFSALYRKYSGD